MKLRHGSLCSGIGGFELAASWLGWRNIFHCEIDPFCRKVLQHHFPKSLSYGDIRKFSAIKFRGIVDIISTGFPCQPFSLAGKRKGTNDDRFIWPEIIRIIKEARPRWIVFENVPGLLSILDPESLSDMEVKTPELFGADCEQQGETTIIRRQRRVIGSLVAEIQSAGYILPKLEDGTPVIMCLPACATGAPHRRDRIFIVAHTDVRDAIGRPQAHAGTNGGKGVCEWDKIREFAQPDCLREPIANTSCGRQPIQKHGKEKTGWTSEAGIPTNWKDFPTQPALRGGNDGIPETLDGISISKWVSESIKVYGNAVVPQLALELFRIIEKMEKLN